MMKLMVDSKNFFLLIFSDVSQSFFFIFRGKLCECSKACLLWQVIKLISLNYLILLQIWLPRPGSHRSTPGAVEEGWKSIENLNKLMVYFNIWIKLLQAIFFFSWLKMTMVASLNIIKLSSTIIYHGHHYLPLQYSWASLVAQLVKNPPAMLET